MAYKIGDISRGPCCEINKLVIQVVGKHHPPTQRLAFYAADSNQRLDALTAQDRPEQVTAWMCAPSTEHVWDWGAEPPQRLVLEVEAEQGPPIQLPLPAVGITVRQLDQQWNQIVPVLPFVALPGVNSAHDHGTPVLCRAGYIYVFLGNRLWRELEVRLNGERTTYHDIELDKFRVGDHYEDDARIATGKALDDIWLPANWNDKAVRLQLCFSEVQLKGARVRRLEQDAELRKRRCQSPDLRVARKAMQRTFRDKPDGLAMLEAFSTFNAFDSAQQTAATQAHVSWLNARKQAFPLSVVAPQRARQVGFEWMLDQPARYLCDLSGEFPAQALSAARQHVRASEKGTAPYLATPQESSAWTRCIEQICDPYGYSDDELWQAQPPASDVLQPARDRELYGVMLHDAHYRMRHLHTRINDQQSLLQVCAEQAKRYAHHPSALLLQQLMVPRNIGGQSNPLHNNLDHLKQQGRLDLNRFTASSERMQLWRQIEMSQSLLSECLQRPETEQTLADHLSQDTIDYAAGLYFLSQLFVSLATHPAQHDPLAVNGQVSDALTGVSLHSAGVSAGQHLIITVARNEQHPLHRMLWPPSTQQDLGAPYRPPDEPDANLGDGHWRASEWSAFEQSEGWRANNQLSVDSLFLASLLQSASFNSTLTVGLKAAAGALLAIHEHLQGSVEAAEQALHRSQQPLPPTESRPWQLSMALQRRGVAQLRSLMPQTFGDLQFVPYAEARQKDYYVFGLEQPPRQLNRSGNAYGVYRNQYGALPIPAEMNGHSLSEPELPAGRIVLGIPRNHRTALVIEAVNRRVNEAWQLEMQALAAQQTQQTSSLTAAAKQVETAKGDWAFRALNSVPFTAGVAMLELWNLRNELAGWEQTAKEKHVLRGGAGAFGGIVDLSIALEALTVKLAGSKSVWAAARKILFTVSDVTAKRLLGSFSNRLVKQYSARLLVQISAGMIFVGLNLYDAWYAYKSGDDAYIGYLLMAAGGLVGVGSSFVVAGSTFLGLGPAGWVCLLLITVGAIVAYLLSSKPLKDWLETGPFAAHPKNAVEHLQDPEQAFYYLISQFADIRIGIDPNPAYVLYAKADAHDEVPYAIRTANTRVRIESKLGGLLSGHGQLETQAWLRLKTFEIFFEPYSEYPRTQSTDTLVPAVGSRLLPDALELFVTTPVTFTADAANNLPGVYHHWSVRAQFALNHGGKTWVFPAPPPKDPTPFDPSYAKPDFESVESLFWADETIHKLKGAP